MKSVKNEIQRKAGNKLKNTDERCTFSTQTLVEGTYFLIAEQGGKRVSTKFSVIK